MDLWTPGPLRRDTKIYVAGHRGLVGSAIWRHLQAQGFTNLVGRTSAELDLTRRDDVHDFLADIRPEVIVLAAALVGGIAANDSRPVDFVSNNLLIQVNVMDAALAARVPRLMFLGSSCIYPRLAEQPIREEQLLAGPLESTNEAYAIAKIAGVIQVRSVRRQHGLPWIAAMPTNLYGPGDTFTPDRSHVLAALIARYVAAERAGDEVVTNWGTGLPRREFMHVDDMAAACLYLLEGYDEPEHINVGVGEDLAIAELAAMVADAAGFAGETRWDADKPDGTPRKLLDVSRLAATGFTPKIPLREGIVHTVAWYRQHVLDAG